MSTVHEFGRQRIRISGNLVEATFSGTITEAEFTELISYYDRIIAEHGRLCVVADMQQSNSIDHKGRRRIVEWARKNSHNYHIAVFGGSRPIFAIITLLLAALRLLSGDYGDVAFFDTAEQARRFIAPYLISPSPPGPAAG